MELKAIAEMLKELNHAGELFLKQHEEELNVLINKKETSAEENLQKEILLELLEHVYGIHHITEYAKRKIGRTGSLSRNEDDEILFDGEILPLMTEMEVLVYDEDFKQEIWTRTFIGGFERKYLVGLDKNYDINGIQARIRE